MASWSHKIVSFYQCIDSEGLANICVRKGILKKIVNRVEYSILIMSPTIKSNKRGQRKNLCGLQHVRSMTASPYNLWCIRYVRHKGKGNSSFGNCSLLLFMIDIFLRHANKVFRLYKVWISIISHLEWIPCYLTFDYRIMKNVCW